MSRANIPENFYHLSLAERLKIVFNEPENVKITAQFIIDAYNVRSKIIFNQTSQIFVDVL